MQNYNQQQQAVILKGIAQQILQMNVPTFDIVDRLFQHFDKIISDTDAINDLVKHSNAHVYTGDEVKRMILSCFIFAGSKTDRYCKGKDLSDIIGNTIEDKVITVMHYGLNSKTASEAATKLSIRD